MDLATLSTEELLRMRGGAPAGGMDLSKVPTEELMRMKTAPANSPNWKDRAADAVQSVVQTVRAPGEMAASMGSTAIGQLVGGVSGITAGLFGGQYGTPEGARNAQGFAGEVADKFAYKTENPAAQAGLETIGRLVDKSKIAGLGPAEAVALNSIPWRQVAQGVQAQAGVTGRKIGDLVRRDGPAMGGGGAAVTEGDAMRRARAEQLPVPVNLSKGEASRNFEQQRFERETAKSGSAAGEILRKHGADENANLTKNLEWFLDETGAMAPTDRMTGTAVDSALRSRSEFLKGKYRDAYSRAEAAGELAKPVSAAPLVDWINENASSAKLAPVISAAENEIVRLGGATRTPDGGIIAGRMPINDVEKTRKLLVRLSKVDETNGYYGSKANEVIDAMTEGQGGKLYGEARQMFKDYAGEFKNQGAIKKLMESKPGTTDRRVAFEDVFKHSVLAGSMDDTAAILRSLEQAGPKGAQATAELKGATIKYLQDQASRNAVKDVNGNPILSYPKLNNVVRELEADGKLDLLFGKKGAQQIRDITDVIGDLNVAPAGVINTSGTAAVLKEALGAALTGRVPTALAKSFAGIKSAVGEYRDVRLAREALEPPTKNVIH